MNIDPNLTPRLRHVARAAAVVVGLVLLLAAPASSAVIGTTTVTTYHGSQRAQVAEEEWCSDDWNDGERACEVREYTLGAMPLDVSAINGGIGVEAWDRNEILVRARVSAHGDGAQSVVDRVEVRTAGGEVQADGPRTRDGLGWSVSYKILVPTANDLDLESENGGISIRGVRGTVRFRTTNGGVTLSGVAGDVAGQTRNGGVSVTLTGDRWDGAGLDVETRNGGVRINVPAGYSAQLETSTRNGRVRMDSALGSAEPVRGSDGRRRVSAQLGSGGAPVRVVTLNGGVRVEQTS